MEDYNWTVEYINERINNMENMKTRKFWMVTGDGNTPKVRHYSFGEASREAERLARRNPNTEFYILVSAELVVQPSGVTRTKL